METRANYILIGCFTLAVILGAFGFVYWFHHVGGTGERMTYRVMFQGPIGGLRAGASVTFNGIRVGEVTELSLDPKDPKNSLATISINASTPVRADTEVSLDSQGLTGIAVLALRGGSSSAGPLTAKMEGTPVLTAGSSASQDMMAAARDVARRIDAVLVENQAALKSSIKNIETFTDMLAKNSEALSKSVRNIESFTDALAKNSEKVDRILVSVDALMAEKGDVPEAVRAFRTLAENLDKRLEGLIVDGRRTLNTVDRAVRNFDENPSRIIFGGGRPAAQPQRRPQATTGGARAFTP